MKYVYVVMGVTGEYSDRQEWPVAAYLRKEDADRHEHLADVEAMRVQPLWGDRYDWPRDENFELIPPPEAVNKYDTKMQMSYTGTSYYTLTVPLLKKVP